MMSKRYAGLANHIPACPSLGLCFPTHARLRRSFTAPRAGKRGDSRYRLAFPTTSLSTSPISSSFPSCRCTGVTDNPHCLARSRRNTGSSGCSASHVSTLALAGEPGGARRARLPHESVLGTMGLPCSIQVRSSSRGARTDVRASQRAPQRPLPSSRPAWGGGFPASEGWQKVRIAPYLHLSLASYELPRPLLAVRPVGAPPVHLVQVPRAVLA